MTTQQENVTVQQAVLMKQQLENEMNILVKQFINNTGLTVKGITYKHPIRPDEVKVHVTL